MIRKQSTVHSYLFLTYLTFRSLVQCNNVLECMATGINYFWEKSDLYPNLPLSLSHGAGFSHLYVQHDSNVPADSNCFWLNTNNRMYQDHCTQSIGRLCLIQYGSPGIGSTVRAPDYIKGGIHCGEKPTPDSASKLVLAPVDEQPFLMCPGESAKYVCNAGGINVLKVFKYFYSV